MDCGPARTCKCCLSGIILVIWDMSKGKADEFGHEKVVAPQFDLRRPDPPAVHPRECQSSARRLHPEPFDQVAVVYRDWFRLLSSWKHGTEARPWSVPFPFSTQLACSGISRLELCKTEKSLVCSGRLVKKTRFPHTRTTTTGRNGAVRE